MYCAFISPLAAGLEGKGELTAKRFADHVHSLLDPPTKYFNVIADLEVNWKQRRVDRTEWEQIVAVAASRGLIPLGSERALLMAASMTDDLGRGSGGGGEAGRRHGRMVTLCSAWTLRAPLLVPAGCHSIPDSIFPKVATSGLLL